jgi:hypothetical protein
MILGHGGLVVASYLVTEETGTMGLEIKSRQGIGSSFWNKKESCLESALSLSVFL